MNDPKHLKSISKFLSLVLRHKPETIGLILDENGWTSVDELINKMNANGKNIDQDLLEEVVRTNNKQRFKFNEDKTKIRASQGHSLEINLNYQRKTPPEYLYHGTASKNVESIMSQGLVKRSRHHVHLSLDKETAVMVGQRHGKPVIFKVKSLDMHQDGHEFFESDNVVWLTDQVPVDYLELEA